MIIRHTSHFIRHQCLACSVPIALLDECVGRAGRRSGPQVELIILVVICLLFCRLINDVTSTRTIPHGVRDLLSAAHHRFRHHNFCMMRGCARACLTMLARVRKCASLFRATHCVQSNVSAFSVTPCHQY